MTQTPTTFPSDIFKREEAQHKEFYRDLHMKKFRGAFIFENYFQVNSWERGLIGDFKVLGGERRRNCVWVFPWGAQILMANLTKDWDLRPVLGQEFSHVEFECCPPAEIKARILSMVRIKLD